MIMVMIAADAEQKNMFVSKGIDGERGKITITE